MEKWICEEETNTMWEIGGEKGKGDRFLKLKKMKILDFAKRSVDSKEECRTYCLHNYSCMANTYDASMDACLGVET